MDQAQCYAGHWNGEGFAGVFREFKKFILRSDMDSARQVARILAEAPFPGEIAVLDIGAGDGLVSLAFLEELSCRAHVGFYEAFDISLDLTRQLQLKREEFLRHAERTVLRRADAAVFRAKRRYDIIAAFNSWYGIPFSAAVRYLSYLKKGGRLAILLNSKENITIDLTQKFIEPVVSSEEFVEWLQDHTIAHTVYDLVSNVLNRESFLSSSGLRDEARPFYRYVLRLPAGDLPDGIEEHLAEKPDSYFRLPQQLILTHAQPWDTPGIPRMIL